MPSKSLLNFEKAKQGHNGVILVKKENPKYDPTKEENNTNPQLMSVTDRQRVNEEFHMASLKITRSKMLMTVLQLSGNVDIGADTIPSEYLNHKVLTEEESNGIESEITHDELQYARFPR